MKNSLHKSSKLFVFTVIIIASFINCQAQKNITIDVTEKGVRPNNDDEDSRAIQSIINKAAPGNTIFLPAGKYMIDAPIVIKTNGITIKGEDGTQLIFTNKHDYYAQYKIRVGMINVGANNVTIDHLYLDQNFRNSGKKDGDQASIGGILIGCAFQGKAIVTNNITISSCTVYDYYGDAISVFHASTNNYTVKNNTVISAYIVENWKSATTKAEQGINVAGGNNILITGNNVEGAIDDAIATHTNCSNVKIIDNTVTSAGGRILVNGVTHALVANNSIKLLRNNWTTIMVSFEPDSKNLKLNQDVTIENNKILIPQGIKVDAAIMLYGPGTGIVLQKNIIQSEDIQAAAIILADRRHRVSGTNYFGDNVTIDDNEIINFKTAIQQNIVSAKEPHLINSNNKLTNVEKELLKEKTPFRSPQTDDSKE